METLENYLYALELEADAFAASHPHPFLITRVLPDALRRDSATFDTRALGDERLRQAWGSVLLLHKQGKRLRTGAHATIVLPVTKGVHSPFSGQLFVGRTARADICIPDDRISKVHAYFTIEPAGYHLVDTGSRNGTRVNGERLETSAVAIGFGDEIAFGPFAFTFLSALDLHGRVGRAVEPVGRDETG